MIRLIKLIKKLVKQQVCNHTLQSKVVYFTNYKGDYYISECKECGKILKKEIKRRKY